MSGTLISQLQSSIFLMSLSLIPNNILRYTLLAIIICTAVLCTIHLQRPSTQLHHLGAKIQRAEEIVQEARSYCSRDVQVLLAEHVVRLLEVKRTASIIRCRMLETDKLTVKKYRLLSSDIETCAKEVKSIQTAVQLVLEGERQRKYTEDINETETMLTGFRAPALWFIPRRASHLDGSRKTPRHARMGDTLPGRATLDTQSTQRRVENFVRVKQPRAPGPFLVVHPGAKSQFTRPLAQTPAEGRT
ncbi:hypothetical protein B0H11DRAFT_2358962 [Mycena galericulata]|nr:hypothetical protein B0H11DRAFT_2358962 [Mycena galericulata]